MSTTGSEYLDSYLDLIENRKNNLAKIEETDINTEDEDVEDDYEDIDDDLIVNDDTTYKEVKRFYGDEAATQYKKQTYKGFDSGKAGEYFNILLNETNDAKIAAAILGNSIQESNLNPNTIHDNNTGYGLFGHRLERRDALLNYIKQNRNQPEHISQLQFAVKELKNNYPEVYRQMKAAPNVETATQIFSDKYEKPNKKYANNAQRIYNAKKVYKDYTKAQTNYNSMLKNIPMFQNFNSFGSEGIKDINALRVRNDNNLGVIDANPIQLPFSREANLSSNVNLAPMYKNNIQYSTSSKQYSTENSIPVVDPTTAIISAVDKGLTGLINTGVAVSNFSKNYKKLGANALSTLPTLLNVIKQNDYIDRDVTETGYTRINNNNYYS